MEQHDAKDVFRLSLPAYTRRVAYFLITSIIIVVGTVVAIDELIASPLDALYVLPINILLIALGVNTGYHMYFTHRAFVAAPWFKVLLAYLGSITCQDSILQWVVNHKRHHRYSDCVDRDPHTPHQFGDNKWIRLTLGLAWASAGWKFDRISTSKMFYGRQLLDDSVIRWFDRYFVFISYSGFAIPFLVGYGLGGIDLAVKWFAYFGAFRVFAGYFLTEFVVNGLCHSIGTTKFKTVGESRNLEPIAWLMLGTTLHHNHHAFPRALSPAIDGEWDSMNAVYFLLQKIGAVSNPSVPSQNEVALKKN